MDWRPVVGVAVGLAAAWLLFVAVLWLVRPRGTRLTDIVRVVPDIARLVRDLLADPTTPVAARAALVALLAWLVNPIDLIPEFVPGLGPVDDVVVAVIVLRFVARRLGEADLRRRWRGTDEGWAIVRRLLHARTARG